MKRIALVLSGITMALCSFGQTDTLVQKKADTIRVGGITIIKSDKETEKESSVIISEKKSNKKSNIKTNWFVFDIGFSHFNDHTSYSDMIASGTMPAGASEEWFDLRNGKSVNVNIWLFMQKLNIISHVVNLQYGLGVELNNYRYKEDIKYVGGKTPLVEMNTEGFSKNKLAADYFTVPIMLNLDFTPKQKNGFSLSGGVSLGYLYSDRQKVRTASGDKQKYRGNFDLNTFKLSYIAEAGLGPVTLYASFAESSMFKNSLDHQPYNFGLRFNSW